MKLYKDLGFARVYISVLGRYYILFKNGVIWDCINKEQMLRIIRKQKDKICGLMTKPEESVMKKNGMKRIIKQEIT